MDSVKYRQSSEIQWDPVKKVPESTRKYCKTFVFLCVLPPCFSSPPLLPPPNPPKNHQCVISKQTALEFESVLEQEVKSESALTRSP